MQVPLPTKVKTEPLVPPEVQTVVDPELKATVSPEKAVAAPVGGAADARRGRRRRGEGDRLVALADREGLLDLRRGVVGPVPGLVGVEDAGCRSPGS